MERREVVNGVPIAPQKGSSILTELRRVNADPFVLTMSPKTMIDHLRRLAELVRCGLPSREEIVAYKDHLAE